MRTAYCFDLDGTLTSVELLPAIAAEIGVADEIATLTRVTMDGMISFDQSLRLRALVLGAVPIERIHRVVEQIPLDPYLEEFVGRHRDHCFVVSGNLDLWVTPLVERLGCDSYLSRASFDDHHLRVDHVLDKAHAVSDVRDRGFDRLVAVGDGANDVAMFGASDLAIAFGGVHTPARVATQSAQFVVHEGRELCRLLAGL